jgi:hypothetical protein
MNVPLNERRMRRLVSFACKADDVSLMEHVVSMAQRHDSTVTVQDTLQRGLLRAGKRNTIQCLTYVLQQGVDVSDADPRHSGVDISELPSREALELLVAHGWNVNTGALNGQAGIPLLWDVLGDRELLQWCLDHGADVDPADHTREGSVSQRKPLLERAAQVGDIEIFELLRARGALMHYGVFPNAVMSTNLSVVGDRTSFIQQVNMLRHLLDVVKCDVNELSYGAH